jgi:hypothetical protein
MWRKRRSALFIDFENISLRVSQQMIDALVAWLEDGTFDPPGGKRKLVHKRIYWNSSAERHREAFEAAGFDVVLCEKFATMKNGADIRMALDVVDMCWKSPKIEEYILFSTDSDFVPVLQRLTEKEKISAILVDESRMDAHTAFRIYADILIPMRLLNEALGYKRQKKSILELRKPRRPTATAAPSKVAQPASPKPASAPKPQKPVDPFSDAIGQAERLVVRLASRSPKKHIARKEIEAQLQQIKGFKKSGGEAYLGKRHYQGLMSEIAKRDMRVKVKPGRNNSASVMYVPADEPSAREPAQARVETTPAQA